MSFKSSVLHLYDTHYKKFTIITLLIVFFAIVFLAGKYALTGEMINKGVSLKGGITITVPVSKEIQLLEISEKLSFQFPQADITVRGITQQGTLKAIIIEAADVSDTDLIIGISALGIPTIKGEYSVEHMGAALGDAFFGQAIRAVILAFLFMAIVVFITFRAPVPSFFVVLAAFSDIVCTLAVINLLGVKLSTAGIAAFLMLIGYSVDTDILLTTRVLKNKQGTVLERTLDAMQTGTLMTATASLATIIGYFFTQSEVIQQIMLILSIGLFFDFFMTWVQNAGILRWYLERKHQVQHVKN
ncbi:MAG: protein translocase subunit SecF [Candidatus Woesearchaeota archaeon]|nr:protein translocase subunit SecF [Candidatus Woesearchaeota archaeon]